MLTKLHELLLQQNVLVVGGDFNRSTYCSMKQLLPAFETPAEDDCLWAMGALLPGNDDHGCPHRDCCEFLPSKQFLRSGWQVQAHGIWHFENVTLELPDTDLSAHWPAFMHLRAEAHISTPNKRIRSEQAIRRRADKKRQRSGAVLDASPKASGA